jgi:ABC-type Fe3+ transport system permease subunit
MGTVMLNRMQLGLEKIGSGLSATLRDKVANPQNLLEPATRASIPPEYLPQLIDLLADSIWYAFLTALLLMIIGCAVSTGMGSHTPANTPRPDGKASQ